jgi:hypothetical protein
MSLNPYRFKRRTKKSYVFSWLDEYFETHDSIDVRALYNRFEHMNRSTLRGYLKEYRLTQGGYILMRSDVKLVLAVFTHKVKLIQQMNVKEREALLRLDRWIHSD